MARINDNTLSKNMRKSLLALCDVVENWEQRCMRLEAQLQEYEESGALEALQEAEYADDGRCPQCEGKQYHTKGCGIELAIAKLKAINLLSREERAARFIRESGRTEHTSDCATSLAPGEEPGPCDCTPTQVGGH